MDRPDPAPAVFLALYVATVLGACLWSGLSLAAFGVFAALLANGTLPQMSPSTFDLAQMSVSMLVGLARLAGGLASAAFAAQAAWRLWNGDARTARPATLAALAVTAVSACGGLVTLDFCSIFLWIGPGVFALVALLLLPRHVAPSDAHGWSNEP